MIRKLNFSSLF